MGASDGLGLALNEAKTCVRAGRFDFLGYTFGPHHYRKDGHWVRRGKKACSDSVRETQVSGSI